MSKQIATFKVNGKSLEVMLETHMTLLEVLRDQLGLTGTKYGCGTGQCGACTVLIDGEPTLACLTLAVTVRGKGITTIEGLSPGNELHPVQQAFWEKHGLQCGFCTPGILMTVVAFLKENPDPTELEIRQAISGNLCRCTGYQNIVEAVKLVAQRGL